jgi:hypothetical protein
MQAPQVIRKTMRDPWFPKLAKRFGNSRLQRNSVSGTDEVPTTGNNLATTVAARGAMKRAIPPRVVDRG